MNIPFIELKAYFEVYIFTNKHEFTLYSHSSASSHLIGPKMNFVLNLDDPALFHSFGVPLTIQTIHHTCLTLHICALVIWLFTYTDWTRPIFQEKNTFLEKIELVLQNFWVIYILAVVFETNCRKHSPVTNLYLNLQIWHTKTSRAW